MVRLIILLLGLWGASPADAGDEEHVYDQLTRAVFRIQTNMSECKPGQVISREFLGNAGTGFFITDYLAKEPVLWAVTARHVVDGRDKDLVAKVRLESGEAKREEWLSLPKSNWFTLKKEDKEGFFPIDVAVMSISMPIGYGYKSFTLCEGDKCPPYDPPKDGRMQNHLLADPKVLDHVLLIGFPDLTPDMKALAREPFVRAGIVAYSSRDIRIPMAQVPKSPMLPMLDLNAYVIDAFSWPGNSGGPVMREPSPLQRKIQLFGLLTGSPDPLHDWGIITPVSSILRTLDAARRASLVPVAAWRKQYELPPSRSCEVAPIGKETQP